MAGVNMTFVGLAHPQDVANAMTRVAMLILEGQTHGVIQEAGGGHWECDGVDLNADAEDEDDTIPA